MSHPAKKAKPRPAFRPGRGAHNPDQHALEERVKELRCLFEVVRLGAESQEAPLEELLQGIAELLPPAWQFPDVAVARVLLDGHPFATVGFAEGHPNQSAPIMVAGKARGRVEVAYLEPRPAEAEGPFLIEERHLLDALAREVATIIERRQARIERQQLERQLMHADRLATIGQLAASVAHELNDPLGTVLGFAELITLRRDLPDGARSDLEQIIQASLQARTIVNKLRLFARQNPPERSPTDLNRIVEEGLFLTAAQCAKQGIRLCCDLEPDLGTILADPGQLHQALTNLTVNAMQAMPEGGALTIRTRSREQEVALIVEDTGLGMTPEILERIFQPFFTTKPPEQGTGLGLSVVQGIITAHGGLIEAFSAPGAGSRFEVRLPRGSRPLAQAVARLFT
jgi:signal transduction histidine kinase